MIFHDFSVIFKFHDFSMHGTFFCDFPGFPGFPVLVGTLSSLHLNILMDLQSNSKFILFFLYNNLTVGYYLISPIANN